MAPLPFLASAINGSVQPVLWLSVVANAFGIGEFHAGATRFNCLNRQNRFLQPDPPGCTRLQGAVRLACSDSAYKVVLSWFALKRFRRNL